MDRSIFLSKFFIHGSTTMDSTRQRLEGNLRTSRRISKTERESFSSKMHLPNVSSNPLFRFMNESKLTARLLSSVTILRFSSLKEQTFHSKQNLFSVLFQKRVSGTPMCGLAFEEQAQNSTQNIASRESALYLRMLFGSC